MTEIVHHQPHGELAADMEYARVVSSGAMLPAQYRGKPADILIAMGLGRAMGLSPAESLYRIHVIQGRPTASAELIAANVRRAGHILRVKGDETGARAVIIRSDDPEFEFESVWNLERAKRLGLADKDGWKKQPGTMMRWRAITEVARLACPEALYGVAYVADEIGEMQQVQAAPRASAADFLNPIADVGPTINPEPVADITDAAVLPDPDPLTDKTRAHLFTLFAQKGVVDRDAQIRSVVDVIGHPITSRSVLTEAEARACIDWLKTLPDAAAPEHDGGES